MSRTNEMTIAAYEKGVEEYTQGSPQYITPEMKQWFDSELLKLPTSAKIFEIGSATGKDADYFESFGYSVERSDATEAFVKLQRDKGNSIKPFNAITDSFESDYDLILANAVLLHFTADETRSVLQKVYASLNEHGVFMFSLKQGSGEEITNRKLGSDRFFKYWNKPEIEEELKSAGFDYRIEEIDDYRGTTAPSWLLITATKENI